MQNDIGTFYNLYFDNWDLITKFWPGSTKWNKSFKNLCRNLEIFMRREKKNIFIYLILYFFMNLFI